MEERREKRMRIDPSRVRLEGLLPDAGGLAVSYGPLMVMVQAAGGEEQYMMHAYATVRVGEFIEQYVRHRIEAALQDAVDRLSAHDLVKLQTALGTERDSLGVSR
jgi:hypothetical protein